MSDTVIHQRVAAGFEFPVIFTHGVFTPENPALRGLLAGAQVAAFFDDNLPKAVPKALSEWCDPLDVPGGEAAKNDLALVERMMRAMLEARLSRHDCVLAVGGGAVLDSVGLAASLVHRGLRLIRLPTTVLSQSDAGVGVKNGVNFNGVKNGIGVFAPPHAVVNDFDLLRTLPDREWIGGIAESFKVAIIRDASFFDWLCEHSDRLRGRDQAAMEAMIVRCAQAHLDHIRDGGDPFERGNARPLDFGHWPAHKLETLSEYRISHGDAVAVGILLDSRYALGQGWISTAEFERIRSGLEASGLPLWFDELGQPALLDGLREFREHIGGELCVTFPDGIGARREVHEIDHDAMRAAIGDLAPR